MDRIRDEVLSQIAKNGVVRSSYEAKQMAHELIEARAKLAQPAPAFDPYSQAYGVIP